MILMFILMIWSRERNTMWSLSQSNATSLEIFGKLNQLSHILVPLEVVGFFVLPLWNYLTVFLGL